MRRVPDTIIYAVLFALSMGIVGLQVVGVFGWPIFFLPLATDVRCCLGAI